MKNLVHNRLFIVLLVLAAIIAISVLAAGIRDMEFREPDPFYFEWPTESGASLKEIVVQMESLPLGQVVMFWLFIVIFTLILLLVLNPKYRWKILRAVLRAALIFILITWMMKAIARRLAAEAPPDAAGGLTNSPTVYPNNLPVYSPPSEVPWISYFFTLAILLGLLWAGWWLWNLSRRARSQSIRENIADIARDTLEDIAGGRDFGDTVTLCYVRMNDAVSSGHGIRRQEGMTPSEFANRLESVGLPGDAVRCLTRLFEEVRYGAKVPGQEESREATVCLNAILAACGRTV
jgi:hypothetical protein